MDLTPLHPQLHIFSISLLARYDQLGLFLLQKAYDILRPFLVYQIDHDIFHIVV